MTRVRDALAGKRFFITGSTGFLGTALVERLLRSIPDSEVVLLIRPGRRATPMQRATKEIVKNDCFDRLRQEYGERFDADVVSRVSAIAGDVGTDGLGLDGDGLKKLSDCDIVIHSAASVSFDSPLDAAVEVNLLGPSRVAAATVAARQLAQQEGRRGPVHFIPVSTAYVAGTHQGEAKEELLDANPFSVEVDWRTEVEAARRQRGDSEAESRRPERLARFKRRPEGSWAAPACICWPSGRNDSGRTGSRSRWSRWARPEPNRSGGPTPIPIRRHWESGHSSRSSATPSP